MLTLTTTAAAATMLRSPGMAVAARVQPLLLRSTACPYSTAATAATTCSHRLGGLRPKLARAAPPVRAAGTRVPRRHATTTTSAGQQDAAAAAVSASQTALHPDLPPLDWNAFFQLRKTRRRWQLACSMVTCAAGGTLGALFLGSGAADPVVGQIPLDPFVTLGLMTSGFAALGWLVGPSIGSAIFYTMKRKYKMQMTIKESQFFARVKKNRVDPSASSAGNPVPDFYGEKIQSVAGYRQWLRDQRAFNKKRTTFV